MVDPNITIAIEKLTEEIVKNGQSQGIQGIALALLLFAIVVALSRR